MIRFEVKENLSKYVDYLEKEVKNIDRDKKVLEEMAEEFVDIVSEVVPVASGNLRDSGLNPEMWNILNENNLTELELIYTGFTGEGMGEPDDIHIWWEFGKYHRGGYSDILGRDYAYYQEFGQDKFAPSTKVKAPTFEGHHYVASALGSFDEDVIEYFAEEYIRQLLQL